MALEFCCLTFDRAKRQETEGSGDGRFAVAILLVVSWDMGKEDLYGKPGLMTLVSLAPVGSRHVVC
jgi:hypothetical protein